MRYHVFTPSVKNPSRCYVCRQPQSDHKKFIGEDMEVRIPDDLEEAEVSNNLSQYWEE